MVTAMTSGCFNILHPGHVWFLKECKKLCTHLVVAVARDEITKVKRVPVFNEEQRKYMLEHLHMIDRVMFEDEEMPPNNIKRLLESVQPDFYITNTDNPNLEVYKEVCEELEIPFILMNRNNKGMFNISTTEIIRKIRE